MRLIDNAFQIIRSRIDRFGVAQPNIQKLQTPGRILVELPGIDNPERVRKLLQGTAKLEFWETYDNSEVYPVLMQINEKLKEVQSLSGEKTAAATSESAETTATAAADTAANSLLSEMESSGDTAAVDQMTNFKKQYPLFAVLQPSTTQDGQLYPGPVVGTAHFKDTTTIDEYLALPQVKSVIPRNLEVHVDFEAG